VHKSYPKVITFEHGVVTPATSSRTICSTFRNTRRRDAPLCWYVANFCCKFKYSINNFIRDRWGTETFSIVTTRHAKRHSFTRYEHPEALWSPRNTPKMKWHPRWCRFLFGVFRSFPFFRRVLCIFHPQNDGIEYAIRCAAFFVFFFYIQLTTNHRPWVTRYASPLLSFRRQRQQHRKHAGNKMTPSLVSFHFRRVRISSFPLDNDNAMKHAETHQDTKDASIQWGVPPFFNLI